MRQKLNSKKAIQTKEYPEDTEKNERIFHRHAAFLATLGVGAGAEESGKVSQRESEKVRA